jgi:hypothetical protein
MLSAQLSSIARDQGIQGVMATTDFTRAYAAVFIAATYHAEVTSAEVWGILESHGITSLIRPNAVGAAFRRAAWNGLITETGRFRKSNRVSAHRRNVQVWKSLLYVGVAA